MKSHLDLLPLLSLNPWFNALPLRDQKRMVGEADRFPLRPGEMLFRQGDAPNGLYALLKGKLKMSTLTEDGKEAILVVLESGTWFGEISLIDHQPRTHDATALSAAEVLILPQAVFDQLMRRNTFSQAIAALLAARIRMLYGIVEDATLRTTRARIARRLLLLAHGDATMARDGRAMVPVSQESLAMMLGISRQTLSKELKLLVQKNIISLGYRCIDIVSETKLKRYGEA
jgi:CRP/FNR family transcriptional regulator, cyclic AMP receptor protein